LENWTIIFSNAPAGSTDIEFTISNSAIMSEPIFVYSNTPVQQFYYFAPLPANGTETVLFQYDDPAPNQAPRPTLSNVQWTTPEFPTVVVSLCPVGLVLAAMGRRLHCNVRANIK
jgi:hypothetical protein